MDTEFLYQVSAEENYKGILVDFKARGLIMGN